MERKSIADLPQGWTERPLQVVAQINPRHPKELDPSLKVSFVPMSKVSESSWKLSLGEERELGKVRNGYTHFADGDVLLAKITPCMENGKAAVAASLTNGLGCGTTELHVLRPQGSIDSKYLYYFLHQDSFRQEAARNFTGTAGQLRVPLAFIQETRIPLPPLNEQRRIVSKLEEVLGKLEACQERLAKIPVILKRFRQSVLAAACCGRLTADWRDDWLASGEAVDRGDDFTKGVTQLIDVPEEWQWVALDALCDGSRGICYGVIKLGGEDSNGVPCLRTSDVKWLRINSNRVKRIAREVSEQYGRSILRGGEVLVNVRGTLGGVAVVPEEMRGWNVSREVSVVPVVAALPQFVALCIASKTSQNWLAGVEKGVAYTGINLEDLRDLPVPVPRSVEQKEIVRRIDDLFKCADQIEARYQKAQVEVDKLSQSILAKAFRGELIPPEAELARR
jgi:type I restriction enzyme S subunit